MDSKEIVRKAIEFDNPPRLPFFLGAQLSRVQEFIPEIPNDVCDCWEMDRQKRGWFFDNPVEDDWGCVWERTEINNIGQVRYHPLQDWNCFKTYNPPNPRDPFYFERIGEIIDQADGRYVVITSHFNLIERLHMLHGFKQTLEDLYLEPEKINTLLDMILQFKIEQFNELYKHFGERVHGLFLTDDWGTQKNTFISGGLFRKFFFERYKTLAKVIHSYNWHFILHSCGRINEFVPFFIEAGVDVLNTQQPRAYGISEMGRLFAGKVCFLTTVDIQATLPSGNTKLVREEAQELVRQWSTPKGGLIVFNYGDAEGIGTTNEMAETMFKAFFKMANYWQDPKGKIREKFGGHNTK